MDPFSGVYIYVSSDFVAKIHINHLKFQAGVFYIIEKKNCVLVNCDVWSVKPNGTLLLCHFSLYLLSLPTIWYILELYIQIQIQNLLSLNNTVCDNYTNYTNKHVTKRT